MNFPVKDTIILTLLRVSRKRTWSRKCRKHFVALPAKLSVHEALCVLYVTAVSTVSLSTGVFSLFCISQGLFP